MADLNDEIHEQIKALCAVGDKHAEDRDYVAALVAYWQAFDLVPEPQTEYEATTWIMAAIGDANFLAGEFQAGVDNLSSAMHCPGAIGNPFLHLRLGQCQWEVGNLERAENELTRARRRRNVF